MVQGTHASLNSFCMSTYCESGRGVLVEDYYLQSFQVLVEYSSTSHMDGGHTKHAPNRNLEPMPCHAQLNLFTLDDRP